MSDSSSSSSSPPSSSSSFSWQDGFERQTLERVQLKNMMFSQLIQIQAQNTPHQNHQQSRKRRKWIKRNHEDGHARLYNDYFADEPVYDNRIFRRRFRMQRHLFLRLVHAAESSVQYFQQRCDATGRPGLSASKKCTAAIRMLAYCESADRVDEYLRLGESTARVCLLKFVEFVILHFGEEYLRSPTVADAQKLLQINEARGFPGMLGSIDCMHWAWKNCPSHWQGQFQGRSTKPSIILEAIASQDLWIWHSYFGTPGACNDINVLHCSPVFDDLFNGRAPRVSNWVNDHHYDTAYYLTDGIYPRWAMFIPSIRHPQIPKERCFSERQESVRKDVERAFGVLQARWVILRKPALPWDTIILYKIMTTCIILHNMIVEDERDTYAGYDNATEYTLRNKAMKKHKQAFKIRSTTYDIFLKYMNL